MALVMKISYGELVFAFACVVYTGWHIGMVGVVFVRDPAMCVLGLSIAVYGLYQVWEAVNQWWKNKKPD